MISRMAKPEEVLVVENEQGEVVREFMRDTDVIFMYKNMRETLVYLTHVDYNDTERIMTMKLANQVSNFILLFSLTRCFLTYVDNLKLECLSTQIFCS